MIYFNLVVLGFMPNVLGFWVLCLMFLVVLVISRNRHVLIYFCLKSNSKVVFKERKLLLGLLTCINNATSAKKSILTLTNGE